MGSNVVHLTLDIDRNVLNDYARIVESYGKSVKDAIADYIISVASRSYLADDALEALKEAKHLEETNYAGTKVYTDVEDLMHDIEEEGGDEN